MSKLRRHFLEELQFGQSKNKTHTKCPSHARPQLTRKDSKILYKNYI